MNVREIEELISTLTDAKRILEELYIESEGEVTPEIEEVEVAMKDSVEKLLGEGTDSLGRWLTTIEDREETLKAEAAKIASLRKQNEKTKEFILAEVDRALRASQQDSSKGMLYSFKQGTSVTITCDTAALKEEFGTAVKKALQDAGIPAFVNVTLSGSSTAVKDEEVLPAFFTRVVKPRARFTKPRRK